MLALSRPGFLATRPADRPSPESLPAGSQIPVGDGEIAGVLRPLGVDERGRKATYELLVANQTTGPLAAFVYGVGGGQPGERVRWSAITIPPLCSIAVPVEIGLPRRGPLRRVVAQLHADGTQMIVDAPPPPRSGRGGVRWNGIATAALLLAGLCATGYAIERPQVAALAAPDRVQAGQPFQVAYAFGPGTDRAEYSVAGATGHRLWTGALDPHGGALTLTLPAQNASDRYQLLVSAHNPLGTGTRTAQLIVLAAPKVAAHRDVQLAGTKLASDIVSAGRQIIVRYSTDASSGTVKLVDQDGTERASALLNRRGESILIAPQVDIDQDFRVVIDARRGAAITETELPVRIAHVDSAPVPVPVVGAVPSYGDNRGVAAARARARNGNDPIGLVKASYRSGESIVLPVITALPHMSVALLDGAGQEVQRVAVGPDENQVVFSAPTVASDARYTLVASFSRGLGEESIIHTLLVRPH